MKLETLGRLVCANRSAREKTMELVNSWDKFAKSDLQTEDGKEWAARARDEAKEVLTELDEHIKGLIKQYADGLQGDI